MEIGKKIDARKYDLHLESKRKAHFTTTKRASAVHPINIGSFFSSGYRVLTDWFKHFINWSSRAKWIMHKTEYLVNIIVYFASIVRKARRDENERSVYRAYSFRCCCIFQSKRMN